MEEAVTSSSRKCSAVTGSARKIKDNAADWHNLLLRWEKANDQGFAIAEKVVHLKLSSERQLLDEVPPPPPTSPSGAGATELQAECCKLQDVFDKMVTHIQFFNTRDFVTWTKLRKSYYTLWTQVVIVMKMQRLMASQQGVLDLEEFQFGPEGRKVPLFQSWNTKHFGDISQLLLNAFNQELQLKRTILQELAHTSTSDLCTVYLSCWLHQPFVVPQTRWMLEALLLETGHRPL